jgi:hypothetical protein
VSVWNQKGKEKHHIEIENGDWHRVTHHTLPCWLMFLLLCRACRWRGRSLRTGRGRGCLVARQACRWRGQLLQTGRGRGRLMGRRAGHAGPAPAALALLVGRRRLLHRELAGWRWEVVRPALDPADPVVEGPVAAPGRAENGTEITGTKFFGYNFGSKFVRTEFMSGNSVLGVS